MSLANNSPGSILDAASGPGLIREKAIGEKAIGEKKGGEDTDDEGVVSFSRIDRLRNSIPGNDSLLDELIDLFVSDLPKRLSAIARAIECADTQALALQAHALRGGAANFGAGHFDELCGTLEKIGGRGALDETTLMLDKVRRESVRVRDVLLTLKSEHPVIPPKARRFAPT